MLAIGDPFGVGQTVTAGIVSATGRGGLGIEEVEDFIQTDAPINPGNSGGALVDDEGHLIGINTAILSGNSGGNQGIGFAVPINMARHDMDEILAHGKVEHGYLGILPQDVTPAMAKAFNTQETNGALVGEVTPDSPAAHSEPEAGRHHRRGEWQAGRGRESVAFEDRHDGSERDGQSESAARRQNAGSCGARSASSPPKRNAPALTKRPARTPRLKGVRVENLTPETAQELKLPATTKGVVVDKVDPASRAADAGLKPGDVIQQVNHQSVTNVRRVHPGGWIATKDESRPVTGGSQRQHDVPGGVTL